MDKVFRNGEEITDSETRALRWLGAVLSEIEKNLIDPWILMLLSLLYPYDDIIPKEKEKFKKLLQAKCNQYDLNNIVDDVQQIDENDIDALIDKLYLHIELFEKHLNLEDKTNG